MSWHRDRGGFPLRRGGVADALEPFYFCCFRIAFGGEGATDMAQVSPCLLFFYLAFWPGNFFSTTIHLVLALSLLYCNSLSQHCVQHLQGMGEFQKPS